MLLALGENLNRFVLTALALCALLFAACELDGASKKPRTASESSRGDVRQAAPRSAFPMPPAEAAHKTNARRAGWTGLDGRRSVLEDFRGDALVLDFYATYCPPCLEEIPHLVELQRRYGSNGLKIIGLNVGGEEDQAKVPEFVSRFKIQYQLGNPDGEFLDIFLGGNSVIPQTLVFDREGKLIKHFTGYDAEIAAQLEDAIRSALETRETKGEKVVTGGG